MNLCTKLSDRVLDLEITKTAQAKEIASLKKRVKKLERKRKSKTLRKKRLFKIGRSAQVVSSEDEDVFNGEEVFVAEQSEKVVEEVVSAAATITTEEITLAQALAELRSAKPKIVVQEPVLAREKAEKVKEANISWDNVQAMIEANGLLDERLQAREQEELTDEEKARLFVELLKKRKKHFAALRAQEKRNKPPNKAQKKSTMSTYLKHMAGYKQSQLKNKSFIEIQKLFYKAMTRVNMFVDMDTELVKESSKKAEEEMTQESSYKRVVEELE
ncbi:retrovirus-related pol polyprotein from transposon TNT 1-94 [Tanacetum coccineum]